MANYLLDTHAVLWVAENSPSLSDKAKIAILDDSATKYVSIVSAWEVAIKLGTSKLKAIKKEKEGVKICRPLSIQHKHYGL